MSEPCTLATLACGDGGIEFRHSCGPINCDPCADLGGLISICPLTCDAIDNLFESLGPRSSRAGHIDFRCFYIINEHPCDTLRNAKVYMENPSGSALSTGRVTPGKRSGSFTMLGIPIVQEIQTVTVMESCPAAHCFPNEGNFMELLVPGYPPPFKVFYHPNITIWEGNFQKEIRAIEGLHEVVVRATGTVPNVTFTIYYGGHDDRFSTQGDHAHQPRFLGQARSRDIGTISVVTDALDNVIISTAGVQDGSPVNTTAVKVGSETTPPPGIIFECPLRGNPKEIGNLNPGDFLPIWVRRETPPDTLAYILDDFTVRIEGTFP